MAQQRTLKDTLRFAFTTATRCVAFVPDGHGPQPQTAPHVQQKMSSSTPSALLPEESDISPPIDGTIPPDSANKELATGFGQSPGLQWAVVQETSKGPVLQGCGLDPSAEQAFALVRGAAADSIYLASVLPSLATLCKQVSLPLLHPKEVAAALKDTLEQTVSVGIQESIIAYESHDGDEGSMAVTAYLAHHTAVQDHLAHLASLSIDPEWVLPKAACLAAFLAHFSLPEWQYSVDISADETTISLIFNGSVIESRALVGGRSVFVAIDHPSPEHDEELRRFLQHLSEALFAYKERYALEPTVPLTLTGSVLTYPLASTVVAEFVQLPLSELHTTEGHEELLQCAVAVGAALLIQPKNTTLQAPNFRTDELAFTSPLLHWKRPLFALGLGCLAAASAIAWYGSLRSEMIIKTMREDWKKIAVDAHTTSEEVAQQTARTLGAMGPLEEASPEQLLAQGNWLQTTVDRQTSYPLHPDIPRLSDVIAWLSFQLNDISKADPTVDSKCEIQSLHYQLVKHPTKNHPKERYQVRVDFEFLTPSVALARAFHERLVANNPCIDSTAEVKWTPSNGKYRASFFLKDKTHYPPQEL